MKRGNFFVSMPEHVPEETFETVAGAGRVRIERIMSDGQSSPEGFWYDQDDNEWVMVLEGSAALEFADEGAPVNLGPGDWVDIPAHVRHRVKWTASDRRTIWLAVHYQGRVNDAAAPHQ